MRVLFRALVLFLGITSVGTNAVFAQPGWLWKNPLPQGNLLFRVVLLDADTAIAVGSAGTILKTTDGGATWAFQASGTTNILYDVSFTDANTGTVVGASNFPGSPVILHTTDGGATWSPQSSGTPYGLYGVSFTDANTGTAVGYFGTILRTIDGGA